MAKVKIINFASYKGTGSTYAEFFNSFNCPLMSASSAPSNKCILVIDDILTLTFDMELASAQSSTYCCFLATYKGTTSKYTARCNTSRGLNIVCACSDKFVYINHWDGWGYRVEVLYDIVNDDFKFCGWKDDSNGSWTIRNINLNDVKTGIVYKLSSILNFSNDTGVISITNAALFRSGIKSIIDSNFLCCTPVTRGKKILIGEDTFYAIDSNILVPYEEVENG